MDDDLELSDLGFANETTSSPLNYTTVRSVTVNDEACYIPELPTNQTQQHIHEVTREVRAMYIWISSTLMLLCVLAILFNLVILISTRWVNGNKIKGVLLLSLSMSMADCYSLILLGLALLINSFLPKLGLQIHLANHQHAKTCVLLYLEGLRLGGLVTTICHILVLAGYHYLGARQPLCLKRRLTGRIIWLTCIIIWTVPPCVFCVIFYIMGNKKDCNNQFLMKRSFRNWFSIIILCCIGLIVVIYSLIYPIVRKHQYERSKRASIQGGQKIKRLKSESKPGCVTVTSCTPGSYAMRRSQRRAHCEKKREKTHKAIFTTILIVGSLVIGWLPALIYFAIVCDEKQCLFCRQTFVSQKTNLIINFLINTLLILKTAINSCIYAARMKEIKRALNLMCNQCLLFCCRDCLPPERLNSLLELHETRYSRGCSRRTVVNSLNEETAGINGTALFDSSNSLGPHSRRQLSCKIIKRSKGDDTSL